LPRHGAVRIGISGWRYKGWRGEFYPRGLRQKDELLYAARQFNTVEINGTFYSLQSPGSFERWAAETPDEFQFAVKGSRFITHMRKLRDIETPLANFFASGVLLLGRKLGPLLWQFGPNFSFDPDRLERFFELLPRTTEDALKLAKRRNKSLTGSAGLRVKTSRTIRHAMEIRHPSFVRPEFIRLLRNSNIALVCADTVEWPRLMDLTSNFIYVRLHGSEVLYASGYDGPALDTWAKRVVAWAKGAEPEDAERVGGPAGKRAKRDVYLYFDNDAKVRAPFDAGGLIARVERSLRGKSKPGSDSKPSPGITKS
jgi:uncharacterized protein YecE (DUF72 family)